MLGIFQILILEKSLHEDTSSFTVHETNHQILSKDKYKIQQQRQLSFTKYPDTGTVNI